MSLRTVAIAATLAVLPVAAQAYDKPPVSPPATGSSGGGKPTAVPAPAAIGLFALGLAGIAAARRRRR